LLRLGFIITLIALIGAALSAAAAYRVFDQEQSIDRIALARAIDIHAGLVQDRLLERELLARVAVGIFQAPSLVRANLLQPLRASIYAFKTDFVVASWVARVQPDQIKTAEAELASGGFTRPMIRSIDDKQIDPATLRGPIDVVMDIEPRTSDVAKWPGRAIDKLPVVGPTLQRAAASRKPTASGPLALIHPDGPLGIVLAAPVIQDGSNTVAGFITFSYRLGPLLLTNDEMSLFSVVLREQGVPGKEFVADSEGNVQLVAVRADASAPVLRTLEFGDRDWTLAYYPKTDTVTRAGELAAIVALIGLALTVVVCGLFGYVAYNNLRLSREIRTRIDYERRLTAVIDELNHRVKNILAVIQSIVTRTLRHGADIDISRDLLIGRIHAMSNVISLLSESQWQGVKLRGLFEARAIPNADRIAIHGPDITVSARAAQSLSLLFFELASHSDEGHSLVGNHPHIVAQWQVSDGVEPRLNFRWEEFNTSEKTRRPDSEFGVTLLDRVAPEALGGIAKRYFADVSYVYELSAPMETVVDQAEMIRTERVSAPVARLR
jgi:two-component sensor histidine kinase